MKINLKIVIGFIIIILVLGAVFAIFRMSQNSDDKNSTLGLNIVTTISPLTYLTKEIVKEGDMIDTLATSEAHDYEYTPADILKVNDADVLVTTGFEIDSFVDQLRDQVDNGDLLVVRATDFIEPIDTDPHFWLSKSQSVNFTRGLGEVLSTISSDDIYTNNFEKFESQINKISESVNFSACSSNSIFVEHDAFIYVARENNFDVISLEQNKAEEGVETVDPQQLAGFIKSIKDSNSKYIYKESPENGEIDQIALDNNLSTLVLNTMESFDSSKNYLDIYQENLNQLKTGLACENSN